jgi:hypothetical protein
MLIGTTLIIIFLAFASVVMRKLIRLTKDFKCNCSSRKRLLLQPCFMIFVVHLPLFFFSLSHVWISFNSRIFNRIVILFYLCFVGRCRKNDTLKSIGVIKKSNSIYTHCYSNIRREHNLLCMKC